MPRPSPRFTTGTTNIARARLTASVFLLLMLCARGAWAGGGTEDSHSHDNVEGDDGGDGRRPARPAVPELPAAPVLPATAPAAGAPPTAEPSDGAPTARSPMSAAAGAYFDRGLRLYAEHQYAAAIEQFQLGFAVEPRREFLFAQAQAWRLNGNCRRAIPLYQQFIESTPAPVQKEAARLGLDRCAPDRLPPAPAPTATAPLAPTATAPLAPAPVPPPRAPWWRDGWGDLALGSGVAAVGVSLGFAVASNRARDQARSPQTTTEQEFDGLWRSAQRRRDIAIGALIGGVVLLAVGGSRMAVVRVGQRETAAATRAPAATTARGPEPLAAAGLAVWSDGVGLTWRSWF